MLFVLQNAPQVSEECSSPGLESFASTLVECRDRMIDICTLQPECTVVGAENDMTRCGVVTSTVLDLLIGSEIKQVKLINALMEVSRGCNGWLKLWLSITSGNFHSGCEQVLVGTATADIDRLQCAPAKCHVLHAPAFFP